jgi:hypothetical protein
MVALLMMATMNMLTAFSQPLRLDWHKLIAKRHATCYFVSVCSSRYSRPPSELIKVIKLIKLYC